MGIRRKIARLAGKRRARRGQADVESLDRRSYDRPWHGVDRRTVTPALLGASMLVPGAAEAAAPVRASERSGDQPERNSRATSESALRGTRLYVKADSPAQRQAREWRGSRRADAELLEYIASQPTGSWFGDWNGDVARDADRLMDAATRSGQVPTIVAYNIPNRDCGAYSAGGAGSAAGYREWIRDLARGIGERQAIVILEPDAVALVSCLTHEGRSERFSLIQEAVRVLKQRTNAFVYIDAGHADWVEADEMASAARAVGHLGGRRLLAERVELRLDRAQPVVR